MQQRRSSRLDTLLECNDKGSTSKKLLLRTASSLRSGSSLGRGKSRSPKIIKDTGNKPQPVEIWKCSVCEWEIAGTMAATRGKIRYHRKLHDFTGSVRLIPRGPMQPVLFSQIGDSGCSFRCPWCGLGWRQHPYKMHCPIPHGNSEGDCFHNVWAQFVCAGQSAEQIWNSP